MSDNPTKPYEKANALLTLGLVAAIAVSWLALFGVAGAQEVAPGWRATGHWQCGPVRILTSSDGQGGVDFYVTGAWFDNHYTMQRGQLYYQGMPCQPVGFPWPLMPRPRPKQLADDNTDEGGK